MAIKLTASEKKRLKSILTNSLRELDELRERLESTTTFEDSHRVFTDIAELGIGSVNLVEWLYSDKFGKELDLADIYMIEE